MSLAAIKIAETLTVSITVVQTLPVSIQTAQMLPASVKTAQALSVSVRTARMLLAPRKTAVTLPYQIGCGQGERIRYAQTSPFNKTEQTLVNTLLLRSATVTSSNICGDIKEEYHSKYKWCLERFFSFVVWCLERLVWFVSPGNRIYWSVSFSYHAIRVQWVKICYGKKNTL